MGLFLDLSDYDALDGAENLITEAESQIIREHPVLGTLRPDDPVVPPHTVSFWEQVRVILNRVVLAWDAQGWGGERSRTIGPFTKSWWREAGRMEKTELGSVAAWVQGNPGHPTGPVFKRPVKRDPSYLFDTGSHRGKRN